MSRIRIAERSKVKLKICLSGISGSGKTYSALKLAYGITGDWNKIGLIDSESGSGELYSHLGPYSYLDLNKGEHDEQLSEPHSPENYAAAIKAMSAAGMDVIVIDSLSHEWDGLGGCLDIVERLGGRYTDWGKVTPRHKRLVDTILSTPSHVIATLRRKSEYILGEEERKDGGKRQKVQKEGLKAITKEGLEYEFTLQFAIDLRHLSIAEKDRTGLFSDKTPFLISEETGRKLMAWAEAGKDAKDLYLANSEGQKKIFFDYAQKHKIPKEKMRAASDSLIGNEMVSLEAAVEMYAGLAGL